MFQQLCAYNNCLYCYCHCIYKFFKDITLGVSSDLWPPLPPSSQVYHPKEMIQFWANKLDIWADQLIISDSTWGGPSSPTNFRGNVVPTSGETWSNCTERTDSCHISECGLTRLGALHERKHFHIRGRKWKVTYTQTPNFLLFLFAMRPSFLYSSKFPPLVNKGMQQIPPQLEPPILNLASHNSFLVG